MSQIGIKLANHDFFPIIDEAEAVPINKEIELTTSKDGQATVQINLFRRYDSGDEAFIGSLVLEDLKKVRTGDATISLQLSLDERKHLQACAVDVDGGAKQSFSIDVDRLNEGNFLADDFDLEDPFKQDDEGGTFSSSLGEIDEIDLSFTDICGDEDDRKECEGDLREKSAVIDEASFDDASVGGVDLSEFDGGFDSEEEERREEKEDASDLSLDDFGLDASNDSGFSDADVDWKAQDDDFSADDFSFSSDALDVSAEVKNDEESDSALEEASIAREESSISEENDVQDWASSSNEESSYDDITEYEEKAGFPKWLKAFVLLLILALIFLVGMLIFKNWKRTSQKSDGLEVALVELGEDVNKEDESEEVMSIDSLTTEAPQKDKEPFKRPETSQQTKEVDQSLGMEKKLDEEKLDKQQISLLEGNKIEEMEGRKDEEKDINSNATEAIKSEKSEKEDAKQGEKKDVRSVSSGAIKKSVRYRVRWGDTLWDISETFYKTPWKYKKIARYNGIKNPSKILVGKYITIPAK